MLQVNDRRNSVLESKTFTVQLDDLEQYSRGSNHRFEGSEETVSDNKTEDTVGDTVNKGCAGVSVCASPPHLVSDIVRCHRIGGK